MVKFYTKKRKSKNTKKSAALNLVRAEIDKTVDYVKQWQIRELSAMARYRSNQVPICVPVNKNSYIVGCYGIKKHNNIWFTIDARDQKEYKFVSRNSAILYALCELKGKTELAGEILKYDNRILKLQTDIDIYQEKIKSSMKKNDLWRYDYFNTLKTDSLYKLEDSKKRLQKSIDLAKYFKIWMS